MTDRPIAERRAGQPTGQAAVRIATIEPAATADVAEALVEALGRLFVQFAREGRCRDWRVAVEADGHALVLAWEGAALSGCSHDKINQVLAVHEQRGALAVLAAPPILAQVAGRVRTCDRARLRRWLATGEVDGTTPVLNTRAAALGDWPAPVPLAGSPLASLLGPAGG